MVSYSLSGLQDEIEESGNQPIHMDLCHPVLRIIHRRRSECESRTV